MPNITLQPNLWNGDITELDEELRMTAESRSSHAIEPSSSTLVDPDNSSSNGMANRIQNSQRPQVNRKESARAYRDRKSKDHASYRRRKNEAMKRLNETLDNISGNKQERTLVEALKTSSEQLIIAEQ